MHQFFYLDELSEWNLYGIAFSEPESIQNDNRVFKVW